MNTNEVSKRIIDGISKGIDFYGAKIPILNFFKPVITRMADKYIMELGKGLSFISINDSVDLDKILEETINTLKTTEPFKIKTNLIGDIDICQGKVKFTIPFTEERLVLNIEDLENIKKMILE